MARNSQMYFMHQFMPKVYGLELDQVLLSYFPQRLWTVGGVSQLWRGHLTSHVAL